MTKTYFLVNGPASIDKPLLLSEKEKDELLKHDKKYNILSSEDYFKMFDKMEKRNIAIDKEQSAN